MGLHVGDDTSMYLSHTTHSVFFFLNINEQSVKCMHYKSIKKKMIFFTNDITANNKTFCTYQIVNEKNDNGSGHSTTGLNYCNILKELHKMQNFNFR